MTCLSREQLEAFATGALPLDGHGDAQAHLASCDLCQRRVANFKTGEVTVDGVAPNMVLRAAPMPTQIGPYLVLEKLGEGGMGSVFTAYHPELDRKVAIKVLLPQAGSSTTAHARLMLEAKAMAQLDNPHVVAIHDVGTFENQIYLVMDRVNGVTMGQWVKAKDRSWSDIVSVMVQAGRGLEAAHMAGLVHRDFKPANVLVGNDGRVRVADFGIARRSDEAPATASPTAPGADANDAATGLTGHGPIVGTPAYMAPEQFAGTPADARSDQFSFCVSLYEALYAQKPFAQTAGLVNRFNTKPQPPAGDEPSFIRAAILRGLSVSPSDRFESMGALLAELSRQPLTWRVVAPWGALIATFAVMSGAVYWATRPVPVPGCSPTELGVGAVWGATAQADLKRGFQATNVADADSVLPVVLGSLDEYGEAWSRQQRQACATALGAPIDAPAFGELKCLELQRMQYRALIEVLTLVTPEMVPNASSAIASLMPPARCADPHAIASLPRTPNEPALRAKVQALRLEIAKAEALNSSGIPQGSLDALVPLVAEVDLAHYSPLEAELEFALAASYAQLDDVEKASEHFQKAARSAEINGLDAMAANALGSMAFFVSYLGNAEKARMLLDHAEILSERSGRDAFVESQLENTKSLLESFDGHADQALKHQKRAIELRREVFGPRHPRTLNYLGNLAQIYIDLCLAEEAIELMAVFNSPADMIKAPTVYLKGLSRLAGAQVSSNQLDGARTTLTRAKALIEPADLATKCDWHLTLSALALKEGNPQLALESAQTALAAGEALGHNSAYSVFARVAVGAALRANGRPAEAVAALEEALPLHKKLMGDDQIKGVYAELTEAYLAAKRPKDAEATAQQWLAQQAKSCASPEERALAQWAHARALQGLRIELPKARELALEARRTLSTLSYHQHAVAEIDQFLNQPK